MPNVSVTAGENGEQSNSALPRGLLASGAREMGIPLSEHQLDQFERLTSLLIEWNARFNLTRVTEPAEIAVKHYLDSISLLSFVKVTGGMRVMDVGSGAGLPGLPLKIVSPDIQLTVLDSVKKKLSFVEAAAQELGMEGVRIVHARAEDAARDKAHREQYDFVVSRAVARLSVLAELCIPFCRVGGEFVAYKGPDAGQEIEQASKAFRVLGGELEAVHEFTLLHADAGRTLVLVRKAHLTNALYPRKAGDPARTPLE
jgi:16S rRNA (guanine527-N7)-methyltransferase